MAVLKKLEHTIVCLGLAYVSYQRWTQSEPAGIKGRPPVEAIFVGIYIPLVVYFYHLESAYNRFENWFYKRRLRHNGGSLGLWCSILLPLCLTLSCRKDDNGSDLYSSVVRVSHGLLFMSVMWIVYVKQDGFESRFRYIVYSFSSILVSTLCFGYEYPFSFLYACTTFLVFDYTIDLLLALAPRSFTLGEAIVVSQSLSVFCISALFNLESHFRLKFSKAVNVDSSSFEVETRGVVEFVIISLVGCGVLILILVVVDRLRSAVGFYLTSATIAAVFIFPCLYSSLKRNPLTWIWSFLTATNDRLVLLSVWIVFIAFSVLIVTFRHGNSTTVVRKYFHVVIVIVYIPGLLCDHLLLFYTSTLVTGVFCLIECMRLLNIPPLGTAIRNGFASLLDEKDLGPLVVSNIYLLVGCSLPLWLVPYFIHDGFKPTSLSPFAGVIAIGIGDTVASVAGTLFGRKTWPGTKKTFVGTFVSVLAQILFCYLLITFGGVQASLLKCIFPVIVSSLLESFTLQIDNLTLPLFLYAMLS